MDPWKLCEELSIVCAALLAAGQDPAKHYYVEDYEVPDRPLGYQAYRTAFRKAIITGKLPAKQKFKAAFSHFASQEGGEFLPEQDMDLNETTASVKDITNFLASRGLKEGFFFTENKDQPDYLNPLHPCYSSKIAATIEVWQAISGNADLPQTRSPKDQVKVWLRANADRLNLIKDDGSVNEQAIEDIAKVANWKTKGGAPGTPSPKLVKNGEAVKTKPPDQNITLPPIKHQINDEIPH